MNESSMSNTEEARYRKHFPHPPDVRTCIDVLTTGSVKGAHLDLLLIDLERQLAVDIEDAIRQYQTVESGRVRRLVLAALAEIGDTAALDVFVEAASAVDDGLWVWAIHGLRRIGTKEARRALCTAGNLERSGPEQAARFRRLVDEVGAWS